MPHGMPGVLMYTSTSWQVRFRKKILFLCIFLSWMLRAPGVQEAEDGGIRGPRGARAYWSNGIQFESPKNHRKFKINGQAYFTCGVIFADPELQDVFPGL